MANKKFTINHVLKFEYCDGWRAGKILSKKELKKISIKKEERTGENAVLISPMMMVPAILCFMEPPKQGLKREYCGRWKGNDYGCQAFI